MLVLALVGLVTTEVVAGAVATLLDILPHDWAPSRASTAVHILTTPLLGMGTAVLYYALLERERARARNEPAGAGSS